LCACTSARNHLKEAKRHHLNIIVAGHIASDNLGIIFFWTRSPKARISTVIPCSGFVRSRGKAEPGSGAVIAGSFLSEFPRIWQSDVFVL